MTTKNFLKQFALLAIFASGLCFTGCDSDQKEPDDPSELILGTYIKYTRSYDNAIGYGTVDILILSESNKAVYKNGKYDMKDDTQHIYFVVDNLEYTYDGNKLKFLDYFGKNKFPDEYTISNNIFYDGSSGYDRTVTEKENMQIREASFSDIAGTYIMRYDNESFARMDFTGMSSEYDLYYFMNNTQIAKRKENMSFENDADHGETIYIPGLMGYYYYDKEYIPCYFNSDYANLYTPGGGVLSKTGIYYF